MRRALALACLAAALLGCAAEEFKIQVLEDTSAPGVLHVVHVTHHRSSGLFGRRGGPPDDRLDELLAAQAEEIMSIRCPFARQMALARLFLAAAVADVEASLAGASEASTGSEAGEGSAPHRLMRRPSHGQSLHHPTPQNRQDPAAHPEDLVPDLQTAEQRMFGSAAESVGTEGAALEAHARAEAEALAQEMAGSAAKAQALLLEADARAEAEARVHEMAGAAAAAGGFLMPRTAQQAAGEDNAAAAAGEEASSMPFLILRSADAEPAVEEVEEAGVAVEEAVAAVAGEGLGGQPLIPRRPVDGSAAEEDEEAGAVEPDLPVAAALVWEVHRMPIHRMPHGGPHEHGHGRHTPGHHGHMPTHTRGHGAMPLMERHPAEVDVPFMLTDDEVLVQTPDGRWVPVSEAGALPAYHHKPEMDWRLYFADGTLNWGLVTFVALAVACVAVWGAMLAQYATYRSARDNAAAYFLQRVDSEKTATLKPLLHEGPLKGALPVEEAAAHVAGAKCVTVLHYEPLKSRDEQ